MYFGLLLSFQRILTLGCLAIFNLKSFFGTFKLCELVALFIKGFAFHGQLEADDHPSDVP